MRRISQFCGRWLNVRRWGRISLRSFLVGFTLLSIYIGWTTHTRREHTHAILRLREEGAFLYDEFYEPIGPNWLWARSFQATGPQTRQFWRTKVPERVINCSAVFTQGWRQCQFSGNQFHTAHLGLLPKVLHLHTVRLIRTSILPGDIALLKRAPSLRVLLISDPSLDGDAIPFLADLQQVEYMLLNMPKLTDGQRQQLREALPNCAFRFFEREKDIYE